MFAFLNIVEQLNSRTIIIGDDRQLPAIGASRPFKLLLGKSNSKVVMNINTRLQTKEALQLMQDVYAARIDDAFEKLLHNLVEIPEKTERLQAMATYYLGASKDARAEIMPMLPLNEDRVYFNNLVRCGLKQEGTLTGPEISSNILIAKDLTFPETNFALSFEKENLVKFNHSISRLGINRGDYLKVTGNKDHKVLLVDQNNNKVHWDPNRFAAYFKGAIEVYTVDSRQLMAGDQIRWQRNDEARGIVNSEIAEIFNVKGHTVELKLQNGNLLSLDLTKKENQHWDHAYGATVHAVQGLDKRNPIGHGIGAPPYICERSGVKIGDVIIVPGDEKNNTVSRVGKIITIEANKITAIDRYNNKHEIKTQEIKVYPDFTKVKPPNISSLESFLVMATRGDELVMFVVNIEGYKYALQNNHDLKKTALEIMLPELGANIKEKVKTMTGTVYGLANLEEINARKNRETSEVTIFGNEKIDQPNSPIKSTLTNGMILNFNDKKQQNKVSKYNLEDIKKNLEIDILGYVTKWKGEPNKKTVRESRWGTKGSFSVVLSGPKIGTWADFESGAAGKDLISLYMHNFGLSRDDFAKVLAELAQEAGVGMAVTKQIDPKIRDPINKQKELDQARLHKEYINKVHKLYKGSSPIKGTLAETYLNKFRGFNGALPDNFRFKARCWHDELKTYRAALIVPGYDKDGKLQCINRIYLNNDGSKLKEQFEDEKGVLQQATAKRNYGPTRGATIDVNRDQKNTGITFITEGVENALSIKQVQPEAEIISSFGVGQLQNLNINPNTKTIVLCADNDGLAVTTKKPMIDAMQKWIEQGYEVRLAMPFSNKLETKIDFNDLLIQRGEHTINKCLNDAISVININNLSNKTTALSLDFLRIQSSTNSKENESLSKFNNNVQTQNKQAKNLETVLER